MNILQITNYCCASMSANDNTGINRVVTALSEHYVSSYGYRCFNAYYCENPSGLSEGFEDGLKITIPLDADRFRGFLTGNEIDFAVINVSNPEYVREIPKICSIARSCNVKTIYCIHFMPGYEACTYFNTSLMLYNVSHGIRVFDSLKKWLIVKSRPLSSFAVRKTIEKQYRLPLQVCDKVAVFVEQYKDRYLKSAHTELRNKLVAIPNPLPFQPEFNNDLLEGKQKEVIVVGRLYEPTKRLTYALKIWRMIERTPGLDDWKLTLVGDGISKSYYAWLIKRYGLRRVRLVGRQDPKPYYRMASILLSTSAHEGWPMVLMECMPMGVVPCVFESYDAASEIIESGVDGIVVPDHELVTFYSKLKNLMMDDENRIKMAKATMEKSASFCPEIIGVRWKKMFEKMQVEGVK